MSEIDDGIQIEVTVPETTDDTPVVDEAPTVVVVEDNGDSAAVEPVVESAIDHEGRIVRLEMGQQEILTVLEDIRAAVIVNAEATALVAEEVAVVEEQVAEVAEEQQEPAEADEAPDREHPFYRQRKFFGREG